MATFTSDNSGKQSLVGAGKAQGDMDLLQLSRLPRDAILQQLGTSMGGLSAADAKTRLLRYGPNRVGQHKKSGVWYELLSQVRNPLNGLLLFLAVASYFLGDMRAAVVIAAMVVLAVLTAFLQEHRSNQAAQALRAMVHVTDSVKRRETTAEAGYDEIACRAAECRGYDPRRSLFARSP